MRRRHIIVAITSIAIAMSGLGLWIQARLSDAGSIQPTATRTMRQASATLNAIVRGGLAEGAVPPMRQWRSFSGLRSVAGGVPSATRIAVAEAVGGRPGLDILDLDFDSARRATTPSGMSLWMVSGRGVMCLVRTERIAIACSGEKKANRRGVLLQIHRAAPAPNELAFVTIGIVPNWATGISLQIGDVPITLPIQANAFDFGAARSIRVLQLAG
jgi:hypothetical protein